MQKYDCITEHTFLWEYIQTRKHIRLKIAYPFPSLSMLHSTTFSIYVRGNNF